MASLARHPPAGADSGDDPYPARRRPARRRDRRREPADRPDRPRRERGDRRRQVDRGRGHRLSRDGGGGRALLGRRRQ
ncbi:hypothetical protein MICRO80W_630013 [Micrococcus luteus]|nr:hypothetical protein MICRO80W_630013 [Micrococcus luteus]